MVLQLVTFIVLLARIMNMLITPLYVAYLYIIPLVMLAILSTAKDLGKTKTLIAVLICIICRVISLVSSIISLSAFGISALGLLGNDITNVLLAGTTGFMVIGKYLNKDSRGAK